MPHSGRRCPAWGAPPASEYEIDQGFQGRALLVIPAKQFEAEHGAEEQEVLVLKDAIETATMLSTMRFALPSVPPSDPVLVGIGLAVGGDGVMMGTRMVASAEWVEMMHHMVDNGETVELGRQARQAASAQQVTTSLT